VYILPRLCGLGTQWRVSQLWRKFRTEARKTEQLARQTSGVDKARIQESVVNGFSLYILRCADSSLYTGIANDVCRRLDEHRLGSRGAKYLRGRQPFELVFEYVVGDRGAAARLESRIKRLSKRQKEDLVAGRLRVTALVDETNADAGQASGDAAG